MKLLPNWREVLKRAWSVKLIVLAGLLSGAEVAMGYMEIDLPPGVLAALASAVSGAALVARFLAQRGLSED